MNLYAKLNYKLLLCDMPHKEYKPQGYLLNCLLCIELKICLYFV